MRYILFLLLLISSVAYSQSNVDFRGDSARFYKNGGSMEVVIRNSTKDRTNGVLVNTGNGVTSFLKYLQIDSITAFRGRFDHQLVLPDDTLSYAPSSIFRTTTRLLAFAPNGNLYKLWNGTWSLVGGAGSNVQILGDSAIVVDDDTLIIRPIQFETDLAPAYAFQDGDTIRLYPRQYIQDSVLITKSGDTLFFPNGDTAYLGRINSIGYALAGNGSSSNPLRIDSAILRGDYIRNQYAAKETKNSWYDTARVLKLFADTSITTGTAYFETPLNTSIKLGSNKNKGRDLFHRNDKTPIFRFIDSIWSGSAWISSQRGLGVGDSAAYFNTGTLGHFFGIFAGFENTGNLSAGFGRSALAVNTGAESSAFGNFSGNGNTGARSSMFGYLAGSVNKGVELDAFGHSTGRLNTGSNVSLFGTLSGDQNTGNAAIGSGNRSLRFNVGDSSIGIGYLALLNNNWKNRIVLGQNSGDSFTDNPSTLKNFESANVSGTTITITSHGFGTVGSKVNLRYILISGTNVGGLVNNAIYQFTIASPNTLTLSNITNPGSGTYSLSKDVDKSNSVVVGYNVDADKANQIKLGNRLNTETMLRGTVITYDGTTYGTILSSGTRAQRLATAVTGSRYFQTDELIGSYTWDGARWKLESDEDVVFNFLAGFNGLGVTATTANGGSISLGNLGGICYSLSTGSNVQGAAMVNTSVTGYASNLKNVSYARIQHLTLSSPTERYILNVGATQIAGAVTRGSWFRYSDSLNSGRWVCYSTNDGVTFDTTNTSVTVAAGVEDLVILNDGVSFAKFYINGTLVATHTGNLPNGGFISGQFYSSVHIQKTAGTSGRSIFIRKVLGKRIE